MSTKTQPPGRERAQFTCDTMGTTLAIRVRGEIDHHTAASIRQGMDAVLFEKRPRKLILDLSAVSFMDSSGIAVILKTYKRVNEIGGRMWVENVPKQPMKVLDASGIERVVRITALS